MRSLQAGSSVFGVALSVIVILATASLGADTHVIVGTQLITWTYKGQSSTTKGKPLIVDDLRIGDIVEVQIPSGPASHGFITIRKSANADPTETKDLVLGCGEDKSSKPNAVLREIDCGTGSQFGKEFVGKMRLEVLNTFKDQTDFWCVRHKGGMSGALTLKQ